MTIDSTPDRRATIMEVARLAGVSHQTVSRYFRDNGTLKESTRLRVDAAVRELDYRPNLVARSMRTRRTGRLAVVVPTLAFNPARMLAGASATAHAAAYGVDVLAIEGGRQARTQRVLELAGSGQVDGIVSFAPLEPGIDTATMGLTVLVAAEFDDEMRGIGELADAAPVMAFLSRLTELGHSRFLHVSGDLQFASARARRDAFLAGAERLGVAEARVFDGDWTAESGVAAVRALHENDRPTAVIASNDLVAAHRGWAVPRDLSVTGWDRQPIGQFLVPSLTTVDVDLEGLGATAMGRLIAALRKEAAPAASRTLQTVVWGESIGPAPA
ncbi:LacI family DNA-binding transcriptional regulator [Microbacterium sp. 22242]|uniref:LacI family DNA-binding transcriptional regulator n=1 Tax=Microbacterium sp. 22242 TaxID=3453896 RepID=UPI003F842554